MLGFVDSNEDADVDDEDKSAGLQEISASALTSVADLVTDRLRLAILEGRLRPGERILQEQVARRLGISRQPVREALQVLKNEGLVTELLGRGTMVRIFTSDDIRENYHLRRVLEGEACRVAAQYVTEVRLDELRRTNSQIQTAAKAGHSSEILRANYEFHRLIREWTRMPTLVRIITELWSGITIATPLSVPGRVDRSISEHEDIIRAFESGDGEAAAASMRKHIEAAEDDCLRILEADPASLRRLPYEVRDEQGPALTKNRADR
jgi:DNA-binding GntR family transcriptional regulator